MDRIYGSAYVTFCALSSTSCHEGFLSQRGRRILFSFCSDLEPTIFGSYYLKFKYVGDWRTGSSLGFEDILYNNTKLCRWNRRTWTFQERFLSKHNILFGNSRIHSIFHGAYASMGGKMVAGNYFGLVSVVLSLKDKDALSYRWDSVLSEYSEFGENSLTKSSDILPALAGVARIFQHRLEDDYIAGHWKRDLFRNLMWHQGRGNFMLSKVDYIARLQSHLQLVPSWSRLPKNAYSESIWNYSSRCQKIQPEYSNITPDVLLAGNNPFGAIRYAKIRLTTVILHLTHVLQLTEIPKGSHSVFECISDFSENQFDFLPYFQLGGESERL